LKAFEAGRRAALNPDSVPARAQTLDDFIAKRSEDLLAYRNQAYADRYRQVMKTVGAACGRVSASSAFGWAAARSAYNLMAYKDEYEVARLYSRPQYREALDREFTDIRRISLLLSPPIMSNGV
jgi:indolepyruvate ferredoxin oxidoreductase